jgi:hypothetical protein
MTTTYAAVQMIVNGQPYIFSSDVTDAASGTDSNRLLNVVSSRTIGDTFPSGAIITSVGPCTLNSSDAAGASKSILGAVITDPQNNVVAEIPWVDPETAPIGKQYQCAIPVGLNFAFNIETSNT